MSGAPQSLDQIGCLAEHYEVEDVLPTFASDGAEGGFSGGLAVKTQSHRIATIEQELTKAQKSALEILLRQVGLSGLLVWRPAVPANDAGVSASMPTIVGRLARPVSITWVSANRFQALIVLREDL